MPKTTEDIRDSIRINKQGFYYTHYEKEMRWWSEEEINEAIRQIEFDFGNQHITRVLKNILNLT